MRKRREWWVSAWTTTKRDAPEPARLRVQDETGKSWNLVEDEDPAHRVDGVVITEVINADRGEAITYRATIGGTSVNPYLTALHINPAKGQTIDAAFLRRIPVAQIADAAAQFLRESDDLKPSEFLLIGPEDVQTRGFVPDLEEIAERFRSHKGPKSEFTDTLVHEFGVSRATVGRWIKKARDEGYLEKAETGRPRIQDASEVTNSAE